jgi:Ion transport protein
LNTLCLGLDSYPENQELNKVTDICNIVFFGIFFVEMLIKNLGMGPRLYIKDPFNVFDAIIVMVSIIDVILSYAVPGDETD